jgi:hypothetical protein
MALLTKEQIDGRKPVQVAFVVDNLEDAALRWVRTVGAVPPLVFHGSRCQQSIVEVAS